MTVLDSGIAKCVTHDRIVMHPEDGHCQRGEPCEAETYSWDHYRPEQTDAYWIRCTASGPHTEHSDDGNTGLHWPVTADDPVPASDAAALCVLRPLYYHDA